MSKICPFSQQECTSTDCLDLQCSIEKFMKEPQQIHWQPKRNMVIRYSKKFPYAPYLNEDIGFEMTIGEHENPLDKLEELRQMAQQFHEKHNPQLYTETPIQQQYFSGSSTLHDKEGNKIHSGVNIEPIPPKIQPHSTIEAINSCTTLKVLQEFDLIVKNMSNKYPEIQEAYNSKLKELQP